MFLISEKYFVHICEKYTFFIGEENWLYCKDTSGTKNFSKVYLDQMKV